MGFVIIVMNSEVDVIKFYQQKCWAICVVHQDVFLEEAAI